jgi:hypothetical protein
MANARLMSDNVAERATLTALTESGALLVGNLVKSKKSKVYRSTATSTTITGVLAAAEVAAMVALPFCNLSPTATIRVRLYSDAAGSTLVRDTGVVSACPAAVIRLRGWSALQSSNAYANGGGAYARVWFAETSFMRFVIDIVDINNPAGFIESSFLVVAPYIEVAMNPTAAPQGFMDGTNIDYNKSGDQTATAGMIRRQINVELGQVSAADRTKFANALRNSRVYPFLISVYPEQSDLELERDNFILGRRPKDSTIDVDQSIRYSIAIPIEEV